MNDQMWAMILMQALAIYNNKGVAEAVTYLMSYGMTQQQATDAIALYDGYVEQVKAGVLGMLSL